jgi:ketosteroid isomerase-like protein
MKLALALLLLFVPVFAADETHEMSGVLDTWKAAMLKGDAATLDKLYHKDLLYTHSSALVENKSAAIAAATKPGNLTKAIDLKDTTTHVYGNTAIVKTKADITNAAGGTVHVDLLMVWLKSPGGWQLVARQATKLP